MTDFARDPMGLKLMTCNKPKQAPKAPPLPPPAPAPQPAPTFVINPYMQPAYHCYNNFYPQNYYGMPMFAQNIHPHYVVLPLASAPAPAPPPAKKAKPQHVCVNCNDKKKCSACKKIAEAKKVYVCKPTFSNPRVVKK